MKVLLSSPYRLEALDKAQVGFVWPRLGLAYIAAYLASNGIKVQVLDPIAEQPTPEDLKKLFEQLSPDILGINFYTEETSDATKLADLCKEVSPNTKIIVGGPHASALPAKTLEQNKSFDIAVYGEGEQTMLALVEALDGEKTLGEVKGIAYKVDGKIRENSPRPFIKDLDSLPFPAWHLFPLKKYVGISFSTLFMKKTSVLELPLVAARGCPFRCIFCFKVYEGEIRYRNPKHVVDEIERNLNEFNAKRAYFCEGTFATNKRVAAQICDELIERGLHNRIKWGASTRVDVINRDLISIMKKAGCDHLSVGVESGNQKILDLTRKGITLEQTRTAFKVLRDEGMHVDATFILGHPHETKETVKDSIQFAKEINPDNASFAIMVPFPGTDVYEMAQREEGDYILLSENWKEYGKQLGLSLELKNLNREELKKLQIHAYLSFYMRSRKIARLIGVYGIRKLLGLLLENIKGAF